MTLNITNYNNKIIYNLEAQIYLFRALAVKQWNVTQIYNGQDAEYFTTSYEPEFPAYLPNKKKKIASNKKRVNKRIEKNLQ